MAVVQHVRKTHPELADGIGETEENDREHSYFNRKVDIPPPPLSPPLSSAASVSSASQSIARRPMRVVSKRGRRRRLNAPTVEKDNTDHMLSLTADRRERRVLKQQEKEHEERVKRLRKWTCARSRTFDEHREMGRGNILAQPRVGRPAKDDGTDAGDVFDALMKPLPSYPLLDHPYWKEEIERGADRLQALWNGGYCRSGQKPGVGQFSTPVSTPQEVSAFQECETVLLGLGSPTSRGGRGRRGRGGRGRGSFGIDRRVSAGAEPLSEELDQLEPDIRDLDLLAESELLLRPVGGYSIIQDILGPSTGGVGPARRIPAGYQQTVSPLKNANAGVMTPRAITESLYRARAAAATGNGLTDNLPLDEVTATTDLDDIELCDDDYRLFNTTTDSEVQSRASTAMHLDGTDSSELVSSGVGGPACKLSKEDYATVRGAIFNRVPGLNSTSTPRVNTDTLGNKLGYFSRGATPAVDPVRVSLAATRHLNTNDAEDSESEAESAADLDSSTDTASPSSPHNDDGSVDSLSDNETSSVHNADVTVSDDES